MPGVCLEHTFSSGTICDTCNLECQNGGSPNAGCDARVCEVGDAGHYCESFVSELTMTFQG
jgi:hypothetical protein